jgi:glycosyltransferase involved in cell wall biosynthesis
MIGDFPRSATEIRGGVESVMLYLGRELMKTGEVRLDVVTLDRWDLGARELSIEGMRVHYLPQSPLRSRARTAHNIHRMAHLLKKLDSDLVHAHIAGPYSDAARASGRPWILTLHGIRFLEASLRTGLLDRTYRRWVIQREEARGVRSAPHVISINPFVESSFAGQIKGRVFRIENPIDDRFFELEQINEPCSLLHVGRLTPRKDLLTLLEAFRSIAARRDGAQLRLAGTPDGPHDPYYDRLRRFVADHGLGPHVHFLGQTEEGRLLEEYSRASLVVLSAVLETAPMAIAESLAAATAVVATDAGGCRHLIDDGTNGRVVPQREPAAFAAAVEEMLAGDGRALTAGARGRMAAEKRFRARRVAEETLAAYRDVLRS